MLAVFIAFIVILRWWRKDRELYQTNWRVKYTQLVFEDGTFNKVASLNNELVSVRHVERKTVREDKTLLAEMKTLKSVSHTNLTSFVGACVEPHSVCVVWEHCSMGLLQDLLLCPTTKMDPVTQISIALDISNGLLYLHSCDIGVHGNLKMSSIILDSHWVAKITDFGLASLRRKETKKENKMERKVAKFVAESKVAKFVDRFARKIFQKRCNKHKDNNNKKKKTKELENESKPKVLPKQEEGYGDLFWTSPERLRRRLAGEKDTMTKESDVYSMGIILCQIVGQSNPYEGQLTTSTPKEIIFKVAHPDPGSSLTRPHIPEDVGRQSVAMATCVQLITACWSEALDKRPSARRVVKKLKRLAITKDTSLWDTAKTVKTRYAVKLAPLIRKTGPWSNGFTSVPSGIKTQTPGQQLDVTVCFWSLVNFTSFAIQHSPSEALQIVQDIDRIIENIVNVFNIHQVTTVSDASMLMSGCDSAHNDSHAPVMADASMVLVDCVSGLQTLQRSSKTCLDTLGIRVGLNSGPVMVAVVGTVTPHLCVFGKTVKSAVQCENDSFANRIHISASTHSLLLAAGMFSMEPRDALDTKMVDGQTSYWLNGRIQETQESQL